MFCQSCTHSAYSVLKPAEQGRLNQSKYLENGRGFFFNLFRLHHSEIQTRRKICISSSYLQEIEKAGPTSSQCLATAQKNSK